MFYVYTVNKAKLNCDPFGISRRAADYGQFKFASLDFLVSTKAGTSKARE